MLSIIVTTLFFVVFLGFGVLFQFLDINAFYTIPLFVLFILFCSLWYKEANTKSLEWKDFALSLLFVGILYNFYSYFAFSRTTVFFSYYYLSAFVCIVLYADSIRFKSLM